MPELPEVETVKNILKTKVVGKQVESVNVYHANVVANLDVTEFQKRLSGQTIHDIKRRGKWLIFVLDQDLLFSHLRMEGKYFLKDPNDSISKHEHVIFRFSDQTELRYHDTRKFGRMYVYTKEEAEKQEPLVSLGFEPWDERLTKEYLKGALKNKKIPIKTSLLDQSIICGIGNIYDDEILFLSKIHPKTPSNKLTKSQLQTVIDHTRSVLELAIQNGGTTIRSFSAEEGVHGRFQQQLSIHGKTSCPICQGIVKKEFIGGRGTYYCPKCQKRIY